MLILWDLNGTALDDMSVWYHAIRRVFGAFGAHPPTIAEFFSDLQTGHFLQVYRKRGITASEDELNEVYVEAYMERLSDVRLYPHFEPTVLALADLGHMQGIVSSQIPALVDPLITGFALDQLPIAHWAYPVPLKDVKFTALLTETGIAPTDAIYIGDTPSDAKHANKVGMRAVTYLNGYLPKELFSDSITDDFIRSLEEVVELTTTGR